MADRSIVVRLRAEISGYRRAMADASRDATRFAATHDAAGGKIDTATGRMVRSAKINGSAWRTAGMTLTAFGVAGVAALGLTAKAAIDWETAWAGVLKTVEGTPEELDRLEKSLHDMSLRLPASAEEIAGVAEVAGQLGIKVNDVAKFTETMVMLGTTTNLSAEEAAVSLARMVNIMGTSVEDIDRMGAAIVDLGNNSATTESEIVDMSTRLAAAGEQAGLSEADVLAFAAALTSVGVSAEAGGTALSKVFTSIKDATRDGGDDLETFAKVANMSVDDFVSLFQKDAAGAINAFIVGMGRMEDAGQSTTGVFKQLHLTDMRLKRSISSLGSAGELLGDSIELSNRAWEENSALVIEAQKRYETTASKIQIAKNAINLVAIQIGENLLPAIAGAASGAASLAKTFSELPDPLKKVLGTFGGVVSMLSLGAGAFLILIPRVIETKKALDVLALTFPKVARAGRIAGASLGVIGAALTVAVAVFGYFANKAGEANQKAEELADTLDEASGAMTTLTRETVYNELVSSKAVDAAKQLGIGLDTITDAALGNADAMAVVNRAIDEGETRVAKLVDQYGASAEGAVETTDAITVLRQTIGDQNESLALAKEKWVDHKAAMGDAESSTDSLTGAITGATDATDDYADALEEALGELDEMAQKTLSAREASRKFEGAIDDAAAAVKNNGKTLDIHTQKGRDNQAALDDIADSTWALIDAFRENGASVKTLEGKMKTGRDEFIRAAKAMGMGSEKAEALANKMGLIPHNVHTAVSVSTGQASATVNAFLAKYRSTTLTIPFKTVESAPPSFFGKAAGGRIYGPGTETSDSIPVRLSRNEHVLSAREVRGLGGHANVERIRAAARRGFADGGHLGSSGGNVTVNPHLDGMTSRDLAMLAEQIGAANAEAAARIVYGALRQAAREVGQGARR